MATETAGRPHDVRELEDAARTALNRIERRRFELLGLTLFVLVAFALGTAAIAFPQEVPVIDEFEGTANALRISLIPLAIGFAVYLFDQQRRLYRTADNVREWERQAAERLQLIYRMKDNLLTAVSHEVRTPLTKALGFAETLKQMGEQIPSGRREEFVGRLHESLKILERLLTDLMDVDRLWRDAVPIRRRPEKLEPLIRQAVERFEFGDEREVTVDVAQIEVNVDGPKVERILETLLANARKHTPPGTALWVKASRDDRGVLLVVEDAGPGIPEGFQDTVFRPFQTGPSAPAHSPGTGIGLTVVERLVELHGGRVWVEDRPGGGASFKVRLSEDEDVAREPPRVEVPEAARPSFTMGAVKRGAPAKPGS